MSASDRSRRRRPRCSGPGLRVRSEDGQALILALAIIVIGLVLGLGAVAYALSSGAATNHDARSRAAQQAADAGVQASLFAQAGESAIGYDLSSGSLGNLLTCVVPVFDLSTGAAINTTAVSANAGNGGCPAGESVGGTPIANPWTALSNGSFDESAFFPNTQTPVNASALGIEFPEVVALGCDTPVSAGAADCATDSSGQARYARDLAILDPVGPLQPIEAANNVYLNGALGLNAGVSAVQSLLGALNLNTLVCGLLPPLCETYQALILGGNISAGNDVEVPQLLLATNTDTDIASLLTNVATLNLGALGGLRGTVLYGTAQGTNVTPGPGANSGHGYRAKGTPVAEEANQIHASGGSCVAGEPEANCVLARPSFTVNPGQPLSTASEIGGSGFTLANGDLSMSSGTISLAAGSYFFCNVDVSGGTVTGPSTGAAQIYVLQPGAPQCAAAEGPQGNVIVTPGISSPTSLQATVNAATETVNPSSVQIYVAGNPSDKLSVGVAKAPSTQVSIGNPAAGIQAMVLYAPRSNVAVTTSAAFIGSAVGWNVTMDAEMVLQDLNLGNYPLSPVVNGITVHQFIECSASVTELAPASSPSAESTDTAGCN